MQVVFKTPTTLPIEACTTFGLNSKVNDNPIGRFGTGLKYAIAVILRLGGKIEIHIDGVQHVFYLKETEFRGKSFDMIRMKRAKGYKSWFYTKLPFTTELGKDWELWQAHRELASNTMDENGFYYEVSSDTELAVEDKGTTIIAEHPEFENVVNSDTPTFIKSDHGEVLFEDDFVQIMDVPSKALYFRNIRVYDVRNECRFTYNFKKDVELTEDRTIKNIWWIEFLLCRTIRNDIKDLSLLKRMLRKSEKDSFETHDLSLHDAVAGNEFSSTVRALHSSGHLGRSGAMYHSAYLSPPPAPATVSVKLERIDWDRITITLTEAGRDDLATKIRMQL